MMWTSEKVLTCPYSTTANGRGAFLASVLWFGYVKEQFLFKVKPPNMFLIAMERSSRATRTEAWKQSSRRQEAICSSLSC